MNIPIDGCGICGLPVMQFAFELNDAEDAVVAWTCLPCGHRMIADEWATVPSPRGACFVRLTGPRRIPDGWHPQVAAMAVHAACQAAMAMYWTMPEHVNRERAMHFARQSISMTALALRCLR